MNPAFSIYLDAVRFAAACLVYLWHSNQRWLSADVLPASTYGHSAVVVFFVLSGFVIAHITDTKERDWRSYAASRLSRLLSVVLPAIVLTVLLDSVGRQLLPDAYDYPYDRFAARIAGSLLMLNEAWWISITYFSNVPYWSITYEFWYYVAFGLLAFVPGRARWVAALGVLVLVGPKILLLAPIWGLGVVLCHWRALQNLSRRTGWLLLLASTVAIVTFHRFELSAQWSGQLRDWIGGAAHQNMTFTKYFLGDYVLGPLVLLHFAGARRVLADVRHLPAAGSALIRWLASFTFTLYLMHQPLFLFWGSVLRGDPKRTTTWLIVTALTAASVVAIAHFTEGRRFWLRRVIHAGLLAVRPPRAAHHAEPAP